MYGGLVSLSFASASVSYEETMMPSPTVGYVRLLILLLLLLIFIPTGPLEE
jgi:hypothetical protein